jgi:hypothetical protein
MPARGHRHGSLPAALRDPRSPVRTFLADRFSPGLRSLQRDFRAGAPPLAVPARSAAPGTVATAADWLLRFLLHPAPDLDLVLAGVQACRRAGLAFRGAVGDITGRLGIGVPLAAGPVQRFTGPVPGNGADPAMLARACWSFALLTEAYRAGQRALRPASPLGRLRGRPATAEDLLALAPDDALAELAGLRAVLEAELLPTLAERPGRWALGPVFAGSELIAADADLVASGLLVQLRVTVKRGLGAEEAFRLAAYLLLDFPDEYRIRELGLFDGRSGYLAAWGAGELLQRLARRPVSLPALRQDFQDLLRQQSLAAPAS